MSLSRQRMWELLSWPCTLPYETCGTGDTAELVGLARKLFSSSLVENGDGVIRSSEKPISLPGAGGILNAAAGLGRALRPWKMKRKVNAMSKNATIALVQMDCVMLDKEANLQKAKTFIEQAAQQHTDLICFPEMFSTGYSPSLIGPKYIEMAEDRMARHFCSCRSLPRSTACISSLPSC